MLGALLKSGTIDTYIAAVSELHRSQYSASSDKEPILRGAALKALLERRKQSQDTCNRAAFVDCEASGISASYIAAHHRQSTRPPENRGPPKNCCFLAEESKQVPQLSPSVPPFRIGCFTLFALRRSKLLQSTFFPSLTPLIRHCWHRPTRTMLLPRIHSSPVAMTPTSTKWRPCDGLRSCRNLFT